MKTILSILLMILISCCGTKQSSNWYNYPAKAVSWKLNADTIDTTPISDSVKGLGFINCIYELRLIDSSVYFSGDTVLKTYYMIHIPQPKHRMGVVFSEANEVQKALYINGKLRMGYLGAWSKEDSDYINNKKTFFQ